MSKHPHPPGEWRPRCLSESGVDAPHLPCPSSADNFRGLLAWFKARFIGGGCSLSLLWDQDVNCEGAYEEWELDDEGEVEVVDIGAMLEVVVDEVWKGYDEEEDAEFEGDNDSLLNRDGVLLGYKVLVKHNGHADVLRFTDDHDIPEAIGRWLNDLPDDAIDADLRNILDAEGFEADWLVDGPQAYLAWADGDIVGVYDDEDEARDAAEERVREGRHAFPWAWNWAWFPQDNIRDEDLKAVGFTVARFRGERVVGVDGAGYSFDDSHFLPLAWRVLARWGLTVVDDDGNEFNPNPPADPAEE